MQPPEGPPVCTGLMARPPAPPSLLSYTNVLSGLPSGISTRPVLCTLPTSEKTFVPGLFALPVSVHHAGPLVTRGVMLYQVLTLLMLLVLLQSPFWAGKGGRGRGRPASPSNEAISAVSSPQTKAPAPSTTSMLNLKPRPRMLSPKMPYSFACSIALRRRCTASGYSART